MNDTHQNNTANLPKPTRNGEGVAIKYEEDEESCHAVVYITLTVE